MALELSQVPAGVQHIILSPHFDDAALSLGGTISEFVMQGDQVVIVTVCSGSPGSRPLTSFASHLHQRWGGAVDPIAVRRAEDESSAALLGAALLWLDELDAIYRHPAYDSVDAIFGAPMADDPLQASLRMALKVLHEQAPSARWYAPLAVGRHVDHRLVAAVAQEFEALRPIWWYEDLPYAMIPGSLEQPLTGAHWSPALIDITQGLARKLDSIACYASQILELFGDEATMRQRLSDYAMNLDSAKIPVERLWRRDDS